ncbi:MAG: class I SAM-dependent methyltransferase [Alphaproteobacteria bacterium]
MQQASLTDRQRREIEYHRDFAARHAEKITAPVLLDVLESTDRRWWNAYWSTYDLVLDLDMAGKRVLVPGCGFGDDAVRLAILGAEVHGLDISSDVLNVAQARCNHFGYEGIHFGVAAAEALPFPDDFFDMVFCLDILHHVDIPSALAEFKRVSVPGGLVVGDELFTHSFLQRHVRESALVERVIYPLMVKWIYRSGEPYITPDEHKIDDDEFGVLSEALTGQKTAYFNGLTGRLFPDRGGLPVKADRLVMRMLGSLARFFAGRIVFSGRFPG